MITIRSQDEWILAYLVIRALVLSNALMESKVSLVGPLMHTFFIPGDLRTPRATSRAETKHHRGSPSTFNERPQDVEPGILYYVHSSVGPCTFRHLVFCLAIYVLYSAAVEYKLAV